MNLYLLPSKVHILNSMFTILLLVVKYLVV